MRRCRPVIRPATREDIEAFSTINDRPTAKAWVADLDGEIIALFGLAFAKGRWFAFCDLRESARQFPMTIMRSAKMVMDEARKQGIRFIYAQADPKERGSIKWLKSLGFKPDRRGLRLYRWGK